MNLTLTNRLNSQQGYPELGSDVVHGAAAWSRIPYNGGKIRFKVSQSATTNLPALRGDDFNPSAGRGFGIRKE